MKLAATIATVLSVGTTVPVYADDLYVPAGNGVVITFDLPAQPAEHNGFFMFANFTASNGVIVETQLFDEAGLLASTTGNYVFPLFTDPTNAQSGQPYAVDIDFSRLSDGATGARLVLTVKDTIPGAFIQFDPTALKGQGFGNGGTFGGYDAAITSVVPFAVAVPEPSAYVLLAAGLLVVLGTTRRTAHRASEA